MKIILTIIFALPFGLLYSQTKPCACKKYENRNLNLSTELEFSNNGTKFDLASLGKWENVETCDKIRSITLIDFDTIPAAFARFRNVEKIRIVGINNTSTFRLDHFNKLKELIVEESELLIAESSTWLSRIEKLTTNKTKITGLESFSKLKLLVQLNMSFSGFDTFPKNFNKLQNLKYLSFGGHTFGEIDLNKIDLAELKQLEYFEIVSWNNNVKGLPGGLNNKICIKINYSTILQADKKKLKKFNCR